MKAYKKILIAFSLIVFLVIVGIPFFYFLNQQLADNEAGKILSRTGYDYDRYGMRDVTAFLEQRFPVATKRTELYEIFKDCDSLNRFTYSREDSLLKNFEEDYIYKVGFWGTLEIRGLYDSLSRLRDIGWYYESDEYDT